MPANRTLRTQTEQLQARRGCCYVQAIWISLPACLRSAVCSLTYLGCAWLEMWPCTLVWWMRCLTCLLWRLSAGGWAQQPPLGLSNPSWQMLWQRLSVASNSRFATCLWSVLSHPRHATVHTCADMSLLGLPSFAIKYVKLKPYADLRAPLQHWHCWHHHRAGESCHKR